MIVVVGTWQEKKKRQNIVVVGEGFVDKQQREEEGLGVGVAFR